MSGIQRNYQKKINVFPDLFMQQISEYLEHYITAQYTRNKKDPTKEKIAFNVMKDS